MSYRPVDEAFWTDPKVRGLSVSNKLLFLYFITNPHANFSGLYYLPMPTLSFETGFSEKDARMGINTLSDGYLVKHDEGNSMFWVVKMAKFQVVSQKQVDGVKKHFKTLQKSYLLSSFAKTYPKIIDPSEYPTDTLPIPYSYPTDTTETETQTKTKESPAKKTAGPEKASSENVAVNSWAIWIDVNREFDRADPLAVGKDLKASKEIGKVLNGDKERIAEVMRGYLRDGDKFITGNGHALSLLPSRINKYLNEEEDPNGYYETPEMIARIEAENREMDAYFAAEEARKANGGA